MTTSPEDQGPSRQPARSPEDPLSVARRYARPGKDARREETSNVPKRSVGHAMASQPSNTAGTPGASVGRSKAARTLAIVGIALWFFPCTLGCMASVVLGLISQRRAQETGESDVLAKIAWIGGALFTVAEVLIFFMYRSKGAP